MENLISLIGTSCNFVQGYFFFKTVSCLLKPREPRFLQILAWMLCALVSSVVIFAQDPVNILVVLCLFFGTTFFFEGPWYLKISAVMILYPIATALNFLLNKNGIYQSAVLQSGGNCTPALLVCFLPVHEPKASESPPASGPAFLAVSQPDLPGFSYSSSQSGLLYPQPGPCRLSLYAGLYRHQLYQYLSGLLSGRYHPGRHGAEKSPASKRLLRGAGEKPASDTTAPP